MVLESADGSFGPVGAVHARWCELHMGAGALAEGLDLSTHFVVEPFEAWGLGTVGVKELVARSVGLEVLSTVAVAHGLDVDVVGVLGGSGQ